jgi:hypothetical protein
MNLSCLFRATRSKRRSCPLQNARMRRIYYTYRAFESRFAFSLMEMGLGIKDKVLHAGNAIRIM